MTLQASNEQLRKVQGCQVTSTDIHASGKRTAVATQPDQTEHADVFVVESGRAIRPQGLVGLVMLGLRHRWAVDAALLFVVLFVVSLQIPLGSLNPFFVAVAATLVTLQMARRIGAYTTAANDTRAVATQRVAQAVGSAALVFLVGVYIVDLGHDRMWLPIATVGALGAMLLHRSVASKVESHAKVAPHMVTRLALLGDGDAIHEFEKIDRDDALQVVVQRTQLDTFDDIRPALRKTDQLIQKVHNGEVDRVVVLATAPGIPVVNAVVRRCSMNGVGVDLLTGATGVRPSRLDIGRLRGFSTVHIRPGIHGRGRVVLKRVFDLVVASLALVALSPVMIAAALAVKLGSSGPVLYKQRRLGRNGQQFEMIKFRSMRPDADQMLMELSAANEADGPLFKIKDDPRITSVGGFLRRTSMDELPQLWNVVRGDMSLVGPRPALAIEADGWPIELFDRLEVPPGITGMWQVNGRSTTSFADYARLDLYYVDNWTIGLDMVILARTIPALLGRDAY